MTARRYALQAWKRTGNKYLLYSGLISTVLVTNNIEFEPCQFYGVGYQTSMQVIVFWQCVHNMTCKLIARMSRLHSNQRLFLIM